MNNPQIHIFLGAVMTFAPCKELLGHKDVPTTMIYTHLLNKVGKGVLSPFDQL
jgi:site-specific recombinase XerD